MGAQGLKKFIPTESIHGVFNDSYLCSYQIIVELMKVMPNIKLHDETSSNQKKAFILHKLHLH